jgi:hypothetical protein
MKSLLLASCLILGGCTAQFGVQPLQSKSFSKEEVAAAFQQRDEHLKALVTVLEGMKQKLAALEGAKKK